jgi:hypothetical protein
MLVVVSGMTGIFTPQKLLRTENYGVFPSKVKYLPGCVKHTLGTAFCWWGGGAFIRGFGCVEGQVAM